MQLFDKLWGGLWVGLVTYLLVIAGTIFLGTKLLPLVAVNTIEVAQPYLDSGPPKVSLIEQRQIELGPSFAAVALSKACACCYD